MAEIGDLVPIDDNNTARWPEGMPPSDVNNAGRADEGILARWHRDTNGSLISTGTSTAYDLTTNQTLTAYYDGLEVTFKAHVDCGANPTLEIGALGATNLVWPDAKQLAAGDILQDGYVNALYLGGTPNVFQVMNFVKGGNVALLDRANTFTENQSIDKASGVVTVRLQTSNETGFPHEVYYTAHSNTAADVDYANITVGIDDNTNGSEEGSYYISTIRGGTVRTALRAQNGILIPDGTTNPTDGDKGAGTINVATNYFINGTEIHSLGTSQSPSTATTTFTGIPSGAKKITMGLSGVDMAGSTSQVGIQIGTSSGLTTTGYTGHASRIRNNQSTSTQGSTTLMPIEFSGGAGDAMTGLVTLTLMDASTNLWVMSSVIGDTNPFTYQGTGSLSLGGGNEIERIALVSSASTLSGGTVNILVEI